MGNVNSNFDEELFRQQEQKFVINIIKAVDIPKLDLTSESDPYVKFSVLDINKAKKSANTNDTNPKNTDTRDLYSFETLFRLDNPNPVWNCKRIFSAIPNSDSLYFDIFDKDFSEKDDYIGNCSIPCNQIQLDVINTLDIIFHRKKHKKKHSSKLYFSIHWYTTSPSKISSNVTYKTLILMRHGESEWNEAQHNKNFISMMKKRDHPLNQEGINQALELNKNWTKLYKNKDLSGKQLQSFLVEEWQMTVEDYETFLESQLILVSPLCRALQTALLTLISHPILSKCGIRLCRNLREVKNTLASYDTLASTCGQSIIERCFKQLEKYEVGDVMGDLQNIVYDVNDAGEKWWSASYDSKNDFKRRLRDFMFYVWFLEEKNIICVGHSLWIKAFFKFYLCVDGKEMFSSKMQLGLDAFCEDLRFTSTSEIMDVEDDIDENEQKVMANSNVKRDTVEKNALRNDLKNKKMQNAGCIRVDVGFCEEFENYVKIIDVTLLFGSKLI